MKSIISYFKEFFYYNNIEDFNLPKVDDLAQLLRSEKECNNFVRSFFSINTNDIFFDNEYTRARHTIISFFLGFLFAIYTGLDKKITSEFSNYINHENIDFTYLWFLTVFIHDLAYNYEKDYNYHDKNRIFENEVFIYDYGLYKYKYNNIRFDKNTYKRYYEYTRIYNHEIDHGISGGNSVYCILKDKLVKAYIKEKENNPNLSFENFNHNKLFFSINQLELFRIISLMVIDHNIWKINDLSTANQFALFELVCDNYKKINIKNDPMLFLLSLIDLIEPFKSIEINKFFVEHVIYALTNTYVEVGKDYLSILLLKLDYLKCLDKWKDRIRNIENLLDVKLEETNNKIIIKW